MLKSDPDSVIVEPAGAPRACVVWLHGLGADGHDFEPIVPQLSLPAELAVRFVFPHAPLRPVTLNGGMPMRAWFDIDRLDFDGHLDVAGIDASVARVHALVAAQVAGGVPRTHIVVAGFSQGGAIALEYLIRHGVGLAGVMALSTFHAAGVYGAPPAAHGAPEIFAAHGTADPVVPYALGQRSLDAFARAGYRVRWHAYPMGHQVCAEEIAAMGAWLAKIFGA